MEQPAISRITHDTSVARLTVTGLSGKPADVTAVFTALADAAVRTDQVSMGPSAQAPGLCDLSLLLPVDEVTRAVEALEAVRVGVGHTGIRAEEAVARVALRGTGIRTAPALLATVAETLSLAGVRVLSMSPTASALTVLIRAAELPAALRALRTSITLETTDRPAPEEVRTAA